MATILQFAERLPEGQDWTAAERAQLRDVGSQLAGMDVVFGKTDDGAPWCVVTDDDGDVMLHVARIGGDFVVHSTAEDEVVEDSDLWRAARRLLGDVLKDRRGVLMAFPPEMLGQTAVLAFLFAAAMRGEFDHWLPHDEQVDSEGEDGHAPGQSALPAAAEAPAESTARHANPEGPANDDGAVTKDAAPAEQAEARSPAPAHDAPRQTAEAPTHVDSHAPTEKTPAPPLPQVVGQATLPTVARTDGGQTTSNAFTANGGDAAGASGIAQNTAQTTGENTATHQAPLTAFVEGTDGDDRIQMSPATAAVGGKGADTFVFLLPTPVANGSAHSAAPKLMGVVGDFHATEGDRIELTGGKAVMIVDREVDDLLATIRPHVGSGDMPVIAGRHMGWDMDGDGREDAYVLLTPDGGPWFTAARAASQGGVPINAPMGELVSPHGPDAPHAPIGIIVIAFPHPTPGTEGF